MKQADVKVGGIYRARVSGALVDLRIDTPHPRKGWWATNLATGRVIHVFSAQRLRFLVRPS